MSAEVAWSAIRKGASYTKKQTGVVFSYKSVDFKHAASSAFAARRRAADIIGGGKLVKVADGKATIHRVNSKRAPKLLEGFRADLINKVTKKARYTKIARSRKASPFASKKTKKVKA